MAMMGYKYDPKLQRNQAIREIFDDMQKLGVPRDMDTIRKWLLESQKELPADWEKRSLG
jgi:CHAD domain-containing protein